MIGCLALIISFFVPTAARFSRLAFIRAARRIIGRAAWHITALSNHLRLSQLGNRFFKRIPASLFVKTGKYYTIGPSKIEAEKSCPFSMAYQSILAAQKYKIVLERNNVLHPIMRPWYFWQTIGTRVNQISIRWPNLGNPFAFLILDCNFERPDCKCMKSSR